MSWSAFQIVVASGAAALLFGSLGYTMSRTVGKARGPAGRRRG